MKYKTAELSVEENCIFVITKGQKKSKLFFQVDVSSKKQTNKQILLYYYETSGRIVFVHFLEKIEDTKKTFRNYLTFT